MKKKFWKILLATAIVVATLTAVAIVLTLPTGAEDPTVYSGTCGTNVNWSLDTETGVLDITGTGAMTDYSSSAPAPWDSYRSYIKTVNIADGVTNIGWNAFSNCTSLESITIPDSVTSICGSAFSNCTSLTSVTFEENSQLTIIGDYAFHYCSNLTSITIPDSVTSIGRWAFERCYSLESITIPDSVTSIRYEIFSYCPSLESIVVDEDNTVYHSSGKCLIETSTKTLIAGCKNSIIPADGSVTIIGDYAFKGCSSLENIAIPDSVTSIGEYAFWDCSSLENITIPDSVTSIGILAFYNCESLKAVYITDIAAWCNIDFEYSGSNPLSYANNLYLDGTLVTNLVIPEGVTSIGNDAFYSCDSLTSVTIPDSVESIGDSAFSGCTGIIVKIDGVSYVDTWVIGCDTSITTATLREGTKGIGAYAFFACTSLESITIPDSVKSIGNRAFYNCTSLESITIPSGVTSIGILAFSGCTNLTSITIPDSVTNIGERAFSGCDILTSVTIGNGVTSIGNYAFEDCSSLTEINFNATAMNDLTSNNSVFYGAGRRGDGITVNIGANVTKIPAYLFGADYSPKITNVVFAENSQCTSIGILAFSGCRSLTSITIPDSVTSIGEYAFYYCTSLASVTIGEGVTSIGVYAFSGCTGIIVKIDGVSYVDTWVIDCDTSVTTVTLREGTKGIGDSAFSWCTSLESITIPDSVTSIDDDAFFGCSSLTSVTIGNGVTSIGDYAFGYCSSLESIIVDENNSIYHSAGNCIIETRSKTLIAGCKNSTIPTDGSVTSIGDYAFYNCTSLESITIPDSVTSIGSSAFEACTKLATVYNCSALNITAGSTEHGYVAYYAQNVYQHYYSDTLTQGEATHYYECLLCGYIKDAADHDYVILSSNGDDTHSLICICGKVYEIQDCSGGTATCIEKPICQLCNTAYGDALGHDIEHHDAKAPDCTNIGWQPYDICMRDGCGYTTYEELDALGHSYGIDNICDICGYSVETETETETETVTETETETETESETEVETESETVIETETETETESETEVETETETVIETETETEIPTTEHLKFDLINNKTAYEVSAEKKNNGNADKLENLVIPAIYNEKSVLRVAASGFKNLNGIKYVAVQNGINEICSEAFSGCKGIAAVYLPNSIAKIGSDAFKNCSSLETIYFEGTVSEWQQIEFGKNWNHNVECSVICLDGTINPNGEIVTEKVTEEETEPETENSTEKETEVKTDREEESEIKNILDISLGCSSSLSGTVITVVSMIALGALTVFRKKED